MSLKSARKCTGEVQNNTDAWSHSIIPFDSINIKTENVCLCVHDE
jgi:hypothetical protein